MEEFLTGLIQASPVAVLVCTALGALVVVAQAVVLLTPSKKDDELLENLEKSTVGGVLLKILKAFAPIQKK